MTTVQNVFDMAIHHMDEQDEQNGGTKTADTNEYRFRTISILNTVIPALYPYSKTYVVPPSGRPEPAALYEGDYSAPDFEQTIPLDDTLSRALLPLYLAAQLLSSENTDLASWFMNRYQEVFLDLRNKIPREFEKISAPYGTF